MSAETIAPTAIDAFVAVDAIEVVGRHRKDLGDIDALARSIDDIGLLNPITLTRSGRLVAGQRRLEACRRLGWAQVPVRFADNLDDAAKLVRAERDENVCRKDVAPSEKVALAETLRELLRAEASQRQGRPGQTKERSENFTERSGQTKPPVRDQLGALVGMSGPSYERARRVVLATNHDDPKIREIANHAMAEMDRTGKVTPAFDVVASATGRKTAYYGKAEQHANRVQSNEVPLSVPPPESAVEQDWVPAPNDRAPTAAAQRRDLIRQLAPQGYSSDQIGERIGILAVTVRRIAREQNIAIPAEHAVGRARRRIDPNRVVRETVHALEGLAMGVGLILNDLDGLDPAEVPNWTASLADSTRTLNRLLKTMKEMAQ